MTDKTEDCIEFIIKDFTKPSLNGNMYNTEAECSKRAIEKFIAKKEVYGELNQPSYENKIEFSNPDTNGEEQNNFFKRVMEIDLSNIVMKISDMSFNSETKCIIGKVKPVGTKFPDLFKSIKENKVCFGMRSLCYAYKPSEEIGVIHDIGEIITFDIVNMPEPKVE